MCQLPAQRLPDRIPPELLRRPATAGGHGVLYRPNPPGARRAADGARATTPRENPGILVDEHAATLVSGYDRMAPVQLSVVIAQVPAVWDVDTNLATVRKVLAGARPGDVVIFPEGLLSGYGEDLSPLAATDPARVREAVAELAKDNQAHVFLGSLFPTGTGWCNAANPGEAEGVWRSHLVSRAAENQRFVLAANVPDPHQHCPSMIVSPRGEVLAELPAGRPGVLRHTIDLREAGDWYLGQRREDVVGLTYHRAD
jgi:predicted amidohydrolase